MPTEYRRRSQSRAGDMGETMLQSLPPLFVNARQLLVGRLSTRSGWIASIACPLVTHFHLHTSYASFPFLCVTIRYLKFRACQVKPNTLYSHGPITPPKQQ